MKFQAENQRYKEQRQVLSDKIGTRELWSVIDHWPLYCGIGNLSRFLAIADILRSTLKVPGHVAEFGSWRGANLMFMTKLLHLYDPHGCKQVHCFDTFEGLTNFADQDGQATADRHRYAGNEAELRQFIDLYGFQDTIVIHKGLIEETLPALFDGNGALTFSFVYLDTDLYLSTKTALQRIHPRLAVGGVFAFDEWNYENYPGEGQAANEFLAEFGESYVTEHVIGARQPSLVIRKIRQ